MWGIVSYRTGAMVSLSSAMSSLGLSVLESNQIYVVLSQIFATTGILPLFVASDVILYMSYFISVFIIHLFVDFILFIPRLAHKWLTKLYGGND